eukprot:114913_1
MFRIYQPAVTRSPTCYASHSMLQSTRLMNEFLQRYERDPISLSKKGTSFNTRLVVTFYTFCGIVVAFKHWNVTQNHFNDNACVVSHRLVIMLLDACASMKDFRFAETVWNYFTKECGFRPNQLMFEHVLKIFAKEDPVHIEKCWEIYGEWVHVLKHSRESLTSMFGVTQYSKMMKQMLLILICCTTSRE